MGCYFVAVVTSSLWGIFTVPESAAKGAASRKRHRDVTVLSVLRTMLDLEKRNLGVTKVRTSEIDVSIRIGELITYYYTVLFMSLWVHDNCFNFVEISHA